MKNTKDQEGDEDRDHSFKRQAIDSLAHCSPREHTRDWTYVCPLVAVTHTSWKNGKVKRP